MGKKVDVQFLSFRPMMGFGTTELRCRQPVDYLNSKGISARAAFVLSNPIPNCRLLVLHRVRLSSMIERIIQLARRRGASIVYDIDDFLTDEDNTDHFARDIEGVMRLTDVVSVSGSYLKEQASVFHSDCRILRNRLSEQVIKKGADAVRHQQDNGTVTIGYFSGSAHHDADFAMIAPLLQKLMIEFPQLKIIVGGKISIEADFSQFGNRFRQEAFRPYDEFIELLGDVDINLAPLDTTSRFSLARSELKFLEAAAFGVSTIASRTNAYSEAIVHGETGFLCGPDDWEATLRSLILNGNLRRKSGLAARESVVRDHGPEAGEKDWAAFYASLVKDSGSTWVDPIGDAELFLRAAAWQARIKAKSMVRKVER